MLKGKFTIFAAILQGLFIVLFAVFVRYPMDYYDDYLSPSKTDNPDREASRKLSAAGREVAKRYPFFMDVHGMIFIGFGFLMTFLKRYGFSSVSLNMFVAALAIQWAILTHGWIFPTATDTGYIIHVNIDSLIQAEFAAAAVLISFGAVLGKVTALQLLIMAIFEVVFYEANEYIVFQHCLACDVGGSMVVHAFGAYFGLVVARVLYTDDVLRAEEKEDSVYHSDLFAMIGTIILWMFWPSFNSAFAQGEGEYRAILNTYFAMVACVVASFATSAIVHKDRFSMVHVQNATLAGGVAIGTMADMMILPWAALFIGSIAGTLSVLGYRFITPFLEKKCRVHDTCGVHNLHGLPGILSALGGIICAGIATPALYGGTISLSMQFRQGPSGKRAGFQAAALFSSLGFAIVGGLITGFILRIPIFDQPTVEQIFDDSSYWLVPDEGFPDSRQSIGNTKKAGRASEGGNPKTSVAAADNA